MINQDEINTLIVAEMRKYGLNDAINLETVKEKVKKKMQEMSQEINEMENPAVAQGPTTFPITDEEQFKNTPDINQTHTEFNNVGIKDGTQPLEIQMEPKMAIIPEIPDFLKNVEPGKIFVYDFNELSVGGENLSNKPFKTLDNPEISKSLQQMWSENGITKAEVYQTKFEKIGEVVFDYKSGSSQFIEKGAEPDFVAQQEYKQNPYAANPEKEIENYLRNNINIDQKVNDVIQDIVKNYFLTNTERALNPETKNTNNRIEDDPTISAPVFGQPLVQNPNALSIQEGQVTIKTLIDDFKKVDTPTDLMETIEGKSNAAKLVYENNQIKKWVLNNKSYYFPSDPMSIRKCYIQ